jgi:glycerol-3-phosphate acyltransferase PlsY
VATTAGVCFGLGWPIGLAYAAVWLALLAITRISSLAGMSAALAAPLAAALLGWTELVPVLAAIAAIVLWLHRGNIGRLLKGAEPRLGGKA